VNNLTMKNNPKQPPIQWFGVHVRLGLSTVHNPSPPEMCFCAKFGHKVKWYEHTWKSKISPRLEHSHRAGRYAKPKHLVQVPLYIDIEMLCYLCCTG